MANAYQKWTKIKGVIGLERYGSFYVPLESALNRFMNFVCQFEQGNHARMWGEVSSRSHYHLFFQFRGERKVTMELTKEVFDVVIHDPALLIPYFRKNEEMKLANTELIRTINYEKELMARESREEKDFWRALQEDTDTIDVVDILELKIKNRITVIEEQEKALAYIEEILFNSPFFAIRFGYLYDQFELREKASPERETIEVSSYDPVVKDLMKIAKNEKLSEETQNRAMDLLTQYQLQSEVEEEAKEEESAQLVLATIEQHYLKGGRRS